MSDSGFTNIAIRKNDRATLKEIATAEGRTLSGLMGLLIRDYHARRHSALQRAHEVQK